MKFRRGLSQIRKMEILKTEIEEDILKTEAEEDILKTNMEILKTEIE